MNKLPVHTGLVSLATALLLLSACGGSTPKQAFQSDGLSSCSIEESPFASKDFSEWAHTYHQTVSKVIAADTESLSNAMCPSTDTNLPAPTDALKELAAQLPPWQSTKKLEHLSEADMGAVLLEYLRTYECAMLEYKTFLYPHLMKSTASGTSTASASGSSSKYTGTMTITEFNLIRAEREKKIAEELLIARQSLQRTLGLTGRLNRLRPVFYDINCFVAASLDLRNQLGLAAEVGSCLPRIRDAHTSLRDLQDLLP